MYQDVFQMRMDQIVERCPRVLFIRSDLCIDKSEKNKGLFSSVTCHINGAIDHLLQ